MLGIIFLLAITVSFFIIEETVVADDVKDGDLLNNQWSSVTDKTDDAGEHQYSFWLLRNTLTEIMSVLFFGIALISSLLSIILILQGLANMNK